MKFEELDAHGKETSLHLSWQEATHAEGDCKELLGSR